eukprot:2822219-Lingulodinium_polyedra.AAC.1
MEVAGICARAGASCSDRRAAFCALCVERTARGSLPTHSVMFTKALHCTKLRAARATACVGGSIA